jgi:heme a synthase
MSASPVFTASLTSPDSAHVAARPRAVALWLLAVAALIFVMVVIGGITRLTESGLSITQWNPVSGAIPPLTAADWARAFDLYKQTPEYLQVNRGMTLDGFKSIFFWEFLHRQFGRLIGLALMLPLAWFAFRRAIPRGYTSRLVLLVLLLLLQGAIGWWMVASGLKDRTDVSHVRLAIHLLSALLLLSVVVWTALDLRGPAARRMPVPTLAVWALAVLALQLMFGAYVAGLNAGFAFNSWPLMGDSFYPQGAPWFAPALRNFVDNAITVQFVHRWLAFGVLAMAILLARRAKAVGARREAIFVHAAVGTQILLGIATLMSGVRLELAALHQATAVLLLATFLLAAHRIAQAKTLIPQHG